MRIDAGVDPVARHERQLAPLADPLRARRRRTVGGHPRGAEEHLVTKRRLGVGVVEPWLEETRVLATQLDLDALPPRAAHVLEEEADRARRGDREDVVLHVAPVEGEARFEPGPWLRARADLVVAYRHRLERRVGRGAGLQPGADRRRGGALQLEGRLRGEAVGKSEED